MENHVINRLLEINLEFYVSFGKAFAATRRRIQPGVRKILDSLPKEGQWLDIGCGSGALAAAWAEDQERAGLYIGTDFSEVLLNEARDYTAAFENQALEIRFYRSDLSDPAWDAPLEEQIFNGVLSFAVFHHIPSHDLRLNILKKIKRRLDSGGLFIHSEWQYQNSPRLMERQLPWENAGLQEDDLEEGDTLLDWRFALPGQKETRGLRYVHIYSRQELQILADESGFEILSEFESDGKEGNLGLYQIWKKT